MEIESTLHSRNSDGLQDFSEKVEHLCEELGLPPVSLDESQTYRLPIQNLEIRFQITPQGNVILIASLGKISELSASLQEPPADLLKRHFRIHGARLSRLVLPYVLSQEVESGEIILWVDLGAIYEVPVDLGQVVEEMLNEVEYRLGLLGIS